MRLANPAPGSKKPEPAPDVPVIVTFTDDWPAATVDGFADEGVAGGGANKRTTCTPYEFVAFANSWMVHIVMSSVGSTLV